MLMIFNNNNINNNNRDSLFRQVTDEGLISSEVLLSSTLRSQWLRNIVSNSIQ